MSQRYSQVELGVGKPNLPFLFPLSLYPLITTTSQRVWLTNVISLTYAVYKNNNKELIKMDVILCCVSNNKTIDQFDTKIGMDNKVFFQNASHYIDKVESGKFCYHILLVFVTKHIIISILNE